MIVVNTRKLVKVRSSILSLKHLTLITCTWRRGKILDEKAQRKNAIKSSVLVASFANQLLPAKWILQFVFAVTLECVST